MTSASSNEAGDGDDNPSASDVLKSNKELIESAGSSSQSAGFGVGPGSVLFFMSIPLCIGTYMGYQSSQAFDKVIGKSFTHPVEDLSALEEGMRRSLATSLATRAFRIATMGTVGCFALVGAGVFYATGSKNVVDLMSKTRAWASPKRQQLDKWLGVKDRVDDRPEIRGIGFDFDALWTDESPKKSKEETKEQNDV